MKQIRRRLAGGLRSRRERAAGNRVWSVCGFEPMDACPHEAIARLMLELLEARARGSSICPSEVARRLDAGAWRRRMGEVRDVAVALALSGRIEVAQRGRTVDPRLPLRGPIRLRLPGPKP